MSRSRSTNEQLPRSPTVIREPPNIAPGADPKNIAPGAILKLLNCKYWTRGWDTDPRARGYVTESTVCFDTRMTAPNRNKVTSSNDKVHIRPKAPTYREHGACKIKTENVLSFPEIVFKRRIVGSVGVLNQMSYSSSLAIAHTTTTNKLSTQ